MLTNYKIFSERCGFATLINSLMKYSFRADSDLHDGNTFNLFFFGRNEILKKKD